MMIDASVKATRPKPGTPLYVEREIWGALSYAERALKDARTLGAPPSVTKRLDKATFVLLGALLAMNAEES